MCYYDESNGSASWDAPDGSLPLDSIPLASVDSLPGAQAAFREPPPLFPVGLGFSSLRGTSWLPLFEDCENKVFLFNSETGCVRAAPWISLRTSNGCVFFVNLVTHQTRWLPPCRWMEDWVSRPSVIEAENRGYGTPLDGTRHARDLLPPSAARRRVEGGAPYLWESGLPGYARDHLDSPLTYPPNAAAQLLPASRVRGYF